MKPDTFQTAINPRLPATWGTAPEYQPVSIRINGIDLIEMIRGIELRFAEAEYDARIANGEPAIGLPGKLAGAYAPLPRRLTLLPSRNLLGEPGRVDLLDTSGKSPLLCCTCGVFECASVLVRIAVDGEHVIWSDFERHRRPHWHYDLAFAFDRTSYEAQLAPL